MEDDYSYKDFSRYNYFYDNIVYPVKNGLAINPNIPNDLSLILVKDENCFLQESLAKNENISSDVVEMLVNMKYKSDRFGLFANLIEIELAKNKNISENTLRLLIEQGDYKVRAQLAKREDLPNEIIDILSRDSDPDVKKELALNPIISESVVKRLQEDSYLVKNNLEKNIAYKRMQKQWID